ncbi:MAG: beta-galactosidase [Planctomycetota bacterium]
MRRLLLLLLGLIVVPPVIVGLDFGGWTVDGPGKIAAGDAAWLRATYDSPQFKPIILRPPSPVVLPSDACRVALWYARPAGDFDLYFLLSDSAGKQLPPMPALTSRATFPAVRKFRMKEWSVWNQAESVSLALPGRIEDHVEPEFYDIARRTEWSPPLSLVGVELRPAKDQRDNEAFGDRDAIRAGKGELCLTELFTITKNGLDAEFNWYLMGRFRWGWNTRPRIFLDDLTLRSGKVRYAIEIRQGYQGPVVWRAAADGDLNRADPMQIMAQKIELPELPTGRYFLETKAWTPDGALDAMRSWEMLAAKGPQKEMKEIAPPLHWQTDQPHHVFPPDTTEATLTLQLDKSAWPKREGKAECVLRIEDWLSRPILHETRAPAETIKVVCPAKEGIDYTATAELRIGETVVDRSVLHFGVASKPRDVANVKIPDGLPTRDELLMSRKAVPIAEHWGSLLSARDASEPLTEAQTREFDIWLDQTARLGFEIISINFGWGEVEPLPGVFRWAEIERRLARAKEKNLRAFLTPTEWGHPLEWPRWVEFEPMLTQHGHIDTQDRSGKIQPAPWDPVRRQETQHWLKAVASRFLDNPTVIGYRTKPFIFSGENRPEVTRTDYSKSSQDAFARWLADHGKKPDSIPNLFVYNPWSPSRTGPDLSEAWRDFMAFRTYTYVESVRDIISAFRAVDPKRQLHIYRSSTPNACEAAIPLLKDGAEFHDEGGPFYFQRAMESMCLQAGIPYTNEGHQFTPPSKALVDSGFFYDSIYDDGWCWLYRWHIHRHEDKRFAALPQVLEFISASMPHIREWAAARGRAPEVLVFGSRADRLLGEGRQGFYANIGGIEVFTALFCYHQLPAHFADELTDWVDLRRFKVVFAAGDIMPEHGMDRLVEHAKAGSKIVLVGDAGKFCPEHRTERGLLAKRLGDLPNVKLIDAPEKPAPPPGDESWAGKDLDAEQVDQILVWAGVKRHVRTTSRGFQCVVKSGEDDGRVYVAVFRRWPGHYDNVWYDEKVKEQWATEATGVEVSGVKDGRWRIEKFHRDEKPIGEIEAKGGTLRFNSDPATAGELQLFRLTAMRSDD